jgi:hypothetical protein
LGISFTRTTSCSTFPALVGLTKEPSQAEKVVSA